MKTVTIEVDPKFLPDGYEAVAYRALKPGEYAVIDDKPIQASYGDAIIDTPWLIIRPVRQWYQVTGRNIVGVILDQDSYDFRKLVDGEYKEIREPNLKITSITFSPALHVRFTAPDSPCVTYLTVPVPYLQYSPKQ